MFVFSCYTGIRFSDMQNLRNQNVIVNNDGYIIEFKQLKTNDFVKLPITYMFGGKSIKFLQKYYSQLPNDFIFPRVLNQEANLSLKLIALLAKFDKNLTFHIARHSFGTNLAAATSDQFLIKELMGHSDIKTSMIYIHISQEQIKEKLKNTKWE